MTGYPPGSVHHHHLSFGPWENVGSQAGLLQSLPNVQNLRCVWGESRLVCILLLSNQSQRGRCESWAGAEGALAPSPLPGVPGRSKWAAFLCTLLISSDPGVWIRRDPKGSTQDQAVWSSTWGMEARLGWELKCTREQVLVLRLGTEFT